MSQCVICASRLASGALCPGHTVPVVPRWAETNRLMCDLIHRGKAPPHMLSTVEEEPDGGMDAREAIWERYVRLVTSAA